MKPIILTLAAALLVLLAAGCEDGGMTQTTTIDGTGPVVSKSLEFNSFDKIVNTGIADFNVTIGSPQTVVLNAQQNIMDVMTHEVRNGKLEVGLEHDVSIGTHEDIRFDIKVPSITQVEIVGVGNIELSGADQDELSIVLTGVGNVSAFGMKAAGCTIMSTGVGNCEIFVLDNLNVTITGVGNVYYKGDPDIHSNVTGLGRLVDAN